MNKLIPPLVALACLAAAPIHARAAVLFVSPTGQSHAEGTAAAPLASLAEAADRAQAGDVIRVASGVYQLVQPVRLSRSGSAAQPIRIEPAGDVRPVFDFSAQAFAGRLNGLEVRGNYWHITGLEVVGAARNGINVSGHHNVIERCATYENQDSGLQLSAPASHNLVLDCDSYRNVDRPTHGENADGFAAKFQIGPGNVFRGCRAWENADDGFDLWKAPEPVRIEYSVAFRNGVDVWGIAGFTGNGNGFKLGGDYVAAAHVVIGCVAMDQPVRGFDQNNNMAGLTVEHCTAVRCKFGFAFAKTTATGTPHVLRDNVARDAPARLVEGTVQERNQWLNADGTPAAATILPPTPITRPAPAPVPARRP
jgi:hypothetical protein